MRKIKILAFFMIAIVTISLLSGCGKNVTSITTDVIESSDNIITEEKKYSESEMREIVLSFMEAIYDLHSDAEHYNVIFIDNDTLIIEYIDDNGEIISSTATTYEDVIEYFIYDDGNSAFIDEESEKNYE